MRVLTTPAEIYDEVIRLIGKCSSFQLAVAWASVGFKAFGLLMKHAKKIEKMVVGTHFYQTHPQFIEAFLEHPNVRFVLNPDGVFHPKVYLFEKGGGGWECIVGSPSFTQSGFGLNNEMAVLVSNEDKGEQDALTGVRTSINGYWHCASSLSRAEWESYWEAWRRKQSVVKNLRGKFGNPQKEDTDDQGKSPLEVPILTQAWADYASYGLVGYTMKIIRGAARIASSHPRRQITIRTFSQSYADHVWSERLSDPNPFGEKFDCEKAPPIALPSATACIPPSTLMPRAVRLELHA